VPEVICDVSPIQYLHQVGLLELLRLRYGGITMPPAVAAELREGTSRRVDLPAFEALDWVKIRHPAGRLLLPIVADLGAGEREVLALGTETPDSLVILDDALARRRRSPPRSAPLRGKPPPKSLRPMRRTRSASPQAGTAPGRQCRTTPSRK
jgi:hypothetical protein